MEQQEKPYLSVLIPALNEGRTLARVLDEVLAVPENLELILVDDGSTDDTWSVMNAYADGHRVRAFKHAKNQGKGAAVRTALEHVRGSVVMIQDADLEYTPAEYPLLLKPIREGRASVVYGSRAFTSHASYSFWYVMGNKLVTLATNILYNSYLSDMETCYKVMPVQLARSLELKARGFELEPEITAKVLRSGVQVYEVPISYTARSRAEGKKLTAMDGVRALGTLLKYRGWSNRSADLNLKGAYTEQTSHEAHSDSAPPATAGHR